MENRFTPPPIDCAKPFPEGALEAEFGEGCVREVREMIRFLQEEDSSFVSRFTDTAMCNLVRSYRCALDIGEILDERVAKLAWMREALTMLRDGEGLEKPGSRR